MGGTNRNPSIPLIFYEYPANDKLMINDEVRKRNGHGNPDFTESIP